LEDRAVPADVTWVGNVSSDWTDGMNWSTLTKPDENDAAIFTGTTNNAPEVPAGATAEVREIEIRANVGYDVTVSGTLITHSSVIDGSTMQPAVLHGIVGIGTLNLDYMGNQVDHLWVKGFVKVQNVNVQNGAVLEIQEVFRQLNERAQIGS
jgi:hypothetical protein